MRWSSDKHEIVIIKIKLFLEPQFTDCALDSSLWSNLQ